MQRRIFARLSVALFAAAVVAAAACSDDSGITATAPTPQAQKGTSVSGTDTSNTPPTTPTPAGPVARVVVTPQAPTVPLNYYLTMTASAYDANGVRVTGKRATWRSADPSIVAVIDSGVASPKALGTTKIYGTVDGITDSATVTVVASVIVTVPPTPPPPAPPAGVASFDLTVTIRGAVAGADTSKVESVAGATVVLTRVGGIHFDTLSVSVPAGSAVTDANGVATFAGLDGGVYTVKILPPAGSTFEGLSGGFGPPVDKNASVAYTLHRKS